MATHDIEGNRLPLSHWTRAELERELAAQLSRRFTLSVQRRPLLNASNEEITSLVKYRAGSRVATVDLLCGMATDIRLEVTESATM